MAVGGFSGMRASLPADFFQLYNDKSGIDAFAIAMLALNGVGGHYDAAAHDDHVRHRPQRAGWGASG